MLCVTVQIFRSGGLKKWYPTNLSVSSVAFNEICRNVFGSVVMRCVMWITSKIHWFMCKSLHWRHNDHVGVSNHQPRGCLLNRLFRRRWKKTSKLRVTGLCAGNSPGTGEFPAQRASNSENGSIWWRHHVEMLELLIGRHIRTSVPEAGIEGRDNFIAKYCGMVRN